MGCDVELIYYMQELFIRGDIGHRFAIVCKAYIASGIEYTVERHAPQLEEIHFLPIFSGNRMIRIGQAHKGNFFILPVLLKDGRRVGADSQDFGAATREFPIAIPQARQLRATVRSHKTAQEGKHNRFAAIVR